jgi:hypothetical protein
MAITVSRGKPDKAINQMIDALRAYQADHPRARIDLYRLNSVSVRIRILDPDFAGATLSERSKAVWKYLDASALSDDAQADISSLILLTPEETETSLANFEFENPSPSRW